MLEDMACDKPACVLLLNEVEALRAVVRRETEQARANEQLGKYAAMDRKQCPFTKGGHTVAELAVLLREGLSMKEIAQRWKLRTIAGQHDIRTDLEVLWMRKGYPGATIPYPSIHEDRELTQRERRARMDAWFKEVERCVMPWVMSHIREPVGGQDGR